MLKTMCNIIQECHVSAGADHVTLGCKQRYHMLLAPEMAPWILKSIDEISCVKITNGSTCQASRTTCRIVSLGRSDVYLSIRYRRLLVDDHLLVEVTNSSGPSSGVSGSPHRGTLNWAFVASSNTPARINERCSVVVTVKVKNNVSSKLQTRPYI